MPKKHVLVDLAANKKEAEDSAEFLRSRKGWKISVEKLPHGRKVMRKPYALYYTGKQKK